MYIIYIHYKKWIVKGRILRLIKIFLFFFFSTPQGLNLQPKLWKHRVLITGPPGKYQDVYKYLLLFLAVSFFPLIISFTFSKNVLSVSFLWQFFCHLNSMVINPMVSSVTHLSRSARNTWFDSFLLPWNPFFSWFLWPPTSTDFHSSSMVNILILSSCGSFPSSNF